ncbi:LysM peptidoglycan-binding domain-containing protein [Xanthovirga aplysinae]|uniref:LysM peptidoglycan-binding domain-containing protein n=1 Tax=Xanthovirga aplysinae TaxID=2529853 RepID=UPI0012BD80C2|nr:LysM peptidoglycan-binding domain-containing protein [Xanthovirga aplysinae]MTI30184.1 LysM peptidoglycan-binding domain-containing protein [Xanthovirga aplysinae]
MRSNLSLSTIFKLLLWICLLGASPLFGHPKTMIDSLDMQQQGNQAFILHKVEAQETLYGLSKKYNVSVDELYRFNPEAKNGLKVGTVLKVPTNKEENTAPDNQNFHVVKTSETLYSIARSNNVSVQDLKSWNKLSEDGLKVGQKLLIYSSESKKESSIGLNPKNETSEIKTNQKFHIVEPKQTLYSISKIYGVEVDELKKWNHLNTNELLVGQKIWLESGKEKAAENSSPLQKTKEELSSPLENNGSLNASINPPIERAGGQNTESITPNRGFENGTEKTVEKVNGIDKVIETGLAEVIENSETKKYLALHRTAPIGTVMRLRNERNNRTIFVRVLGRLPDTGENDKIVIKISKAAYDRLGAINNRFPVEMSYVR